MRGGARSWHARPRPGQGTPEARPSNTYDVTLQGNRLTVILNGETIQDLDLAEQKQQVLRHDGTPAPFLRDRPRRGHIGFQELSRGGDHVQIRAARLRDLGPPATKP